MNSSDAEKYRKQLIALGKDLQDQDDLGHDGQRTVTLDQQSVGRLSRMDALQQQAMAKATQARRDQQKLRIKTALARFDNDEFGYCITCGAEIARSRLDSDPSVPTCLPCATGT